ncbi:Integrase family protein [Paraburkholderia ribeironis]|uniref:Integrase family protein n=2 Tax=Paraburkholderia ribeironis TaxID=1247936 RepID=A0A1N7SKQ9_9BURK|nr:Integrase family protein [Paraburkholderia ribeironis]
MFERFLRHLVAHGLSLATFGTEHIESFFNNVEARCAPGTTTRLRYARMLDRLCRELVEASVRDGNPATAFAAFGHWPEDDPLPLFLDPDSDLQLQGWAQPGPEDDKRAIRNRAIVALLLGAGVTAAELRHTLRHHLVVDGIRPHVSVAKRGPRDSRIVAIADFALPALTAWMGVDPVTQADVPLFPAPAGGKAVNDVLLGTVVRDALESIGFRAPDMSPRVLRNTFARRLLLAGRSNEDTSRILGLVSHRTVTRLRTTITEARSA